MKALSSIAVPNQNRTPTQPRALALRAARAVTMTAALLGGGCYMTHEPGPDPVDPPAPEPPAVPNASTQVFDRCSDLSSWDNWSDFYAACCSSPDAWQTTPGCEAWGPFVPPAMPDPEVA